MWLMVLGVFVCVSNIGDVGTLVCVRICVWVSCVCIGMGMGVWVLLMHWCVSGFFIFMCVYVCVYVGVLVWVLLQVLKACGWVGEYVYKYICGFM